MANPLNMDTTGTVSVEINDTNELLLTAEVLGQAKEAVLERFFVITLAQYGVDLVGLPLTTEFDFSDAGLAIYDPETEESTLYPHELVRSKAEVVRHLLESDPQDG